MNNPAQLPLPTAAYMRNRGWIIDHYCELAGKYATGWIAVHAGRVLASGPALGSVTAEAERLAPPDDIAFQFVDDGTMIL